MEASDSPNVSSAPWATEEKGPDPASAAASAATGGGDGDAFAERPEVFVGAAFAGGLALAVTLRWLGSR